MQAILTSTLFPFFVVLCFSFLLLLLFCFVLRFLFRFFCRFVFVFIVIFFSEAIRTSFAFSFLPGLLKQLLLHSIQNITSF